MNKVLLSLLASAVLAYVFFSWLLTGVILTCLAIEEPVKLAHVWGSAQVSSIIWIALFYSLGLNQWQLVITINWK